MLLTLLALLVQACGGRGSGDNLGAGQRAGGHAPVAASESPLAEVLTPEQLQADIAEITAAPVPEAVDAAVWHELARALVDKLAARAVSTEGLPPAGTGGQVQLHYNPSTARLDWSYALPGDYDQNGEVNLADLVPLSQYLHQTSAGGTGTPWPEHAIEAQIDGDGNGEINSGDITTIAQNWRRLHRGYRVYRTEDVDAYPATPDAPNGTAAQLAGTVELPQTPTGGQRRSFSFQTVPTAVSQWYWVRPYVGSLDGAASSLSPEVVLIVVIPENVPPAARLEQPNPRGTAAHVVWDASSSHDPDGQIVKYEFDFDADGTYDLVHELVAQDGSGGEPPYWTGGGGPGGTGEPGKGNPALADFWYYSPGQFSCRVRVTDNHGAVEVSPTRTVLVTLAQKWHVSIVAQGSRQPNSLQYNSGGIPIANINGLPAVTYSEWVDELGHNEHGVLVGGDQEFLLLGEGSTGTGWHDPILIKEDLVSNNYELYPATIGVANTVVNGHPAGIYSVWDQPGGATSRSYRRALDPLGRTWPGPYEHTRIDNDDPKLPSGGRLMEVGDRPLIFAGNGVYRGNDLDGTKWNGPFGYINLPPGISAPLNSSVLVDGLPAFVYSAGGIDLMYCRAVDELCIQWHNPQIITKNEAADSGPLLMNVGEAPAVFYAETPTNTVRFRRAADSSGQLWSSPVVVADYARMPSSGSWGARALVSQNRPILFFADRIESKPKWTIACNSAGTIWTGPINLPGLPASTSGYLIPTPVDIGGYPAMAWIENHPPDAETGLYSGYDVVYATYR